jgi:hypothetical protein
MNEDPKITDETTGRVFEIPPEGSLGLLALGAVALKPWRQKRIDTGYEAQLLQRVKDDAENARIKMEEWKKKVEEMKRKKQQEDEQKNS